MTMKKKPRPSLKTRMARRQRAMHNWSARPFGDSSGWLVQDGIGHPVCYCHTGYPASVNKSHAETIAGAMNGTITPNRKWIAHPAKKGNNCLLIDESHNGVGLLKGTSKVTVFMANQIVEAVARAPHKATTA